MRRRSYGLVNTRVVLVVLAVLVRGAHASAQDQDPDAGPFADAGGITTPSDDDATADDAGIDEVPPVPNGSRTPPAVPEGQPTPVLVGAVPIIIHDVDLKAGTATVTYWFWARWRGAVDASDRIEIANGSLETREHAEHYVTEGAHYAYGRQRAVVRVDVDYRAFPFDRHVLRLAFEHTTLDETMLRFVVDEASLRNVQSPEISGWITERPRFDVVRRTYRTNWGAPFVALDDPAAYSQFRVAITLRHAPVAAFAKTFLPLLISVLITALVFFIDPADTGARFSLGVAGTFGAVTSEVLVASSLPDIGYMTLSDKAHAAGLAFIFFALLESVIVAHL
ncbi:MAG: hypothetical protein IT379_26500, partial [Deltaproteobacteria bacterium]|nr:hypothetical protein [Deltaproteobacteria bacterium]